MDGVPLCFDRTCGVDKICFPEKSPILHAICILDGYCPLAVFAFFLMGVGGQRTWSFAGTGRSQDGVKKRGLERRKAAGA